MLSVDLTCPTNCVLLVELRFCLGYSSGGLQLLYRAENTDKLSAVRLAYKHGGRSFPWQHVAIIVVL